MAACAQPPAGENPADLVKQLAGPNYLEAMDKLVAMGHKAVPALAAAHDKVSEQILQALAKAKQEGKDTDPPESARVMSARTRDALTRIGTEAAADVFLRQMRDPRYANWHNILPQELAGPAVPKLLEWLQDEDATVRRKALACLDDLGDERAVPALIAAHRKGEATLYGLAKIGGDEAVEYLVETMPSLDDYARASMCGHMARLSHPRAEAVLIEALRNDPAVRVRRAAALGLQFHNTPDARAALTRARDTDTWEVYHAAKVAVGRLPHGPADVLEPGIGVWPVDPERAKAIGTLMKIEATSEEAEKTLAQYRADQAAGRGWAVDVWPGSFVTPEEMKEAKQYLIESANTVTVELLLTYFVRPLMMSGLALQRMGEVIVGMGDKVVDALFTGLTRGNDQLAAACEKFLKQIGTETALAALKYGKEVRARRVEAAAKAAGPEGK